MAPNLGEGDEGYPSGIQSVRVPEGGAMRRIVASSVTFARTQWADLP